MKKPRNERIVAIIDDESVRIDTIARWYGIKPWEALYSEKFDISIIEKADIVFLDHDLGYDPELGYMDVYTELKKANMSNVSRDTAFYVHSMNPVGAENIAQFLRSQGFNAVTRPFSSLIS